MAGIRKNDAPKIQPDVYRAIINDAHVHGMEVLAHLSRTSALADAKDLLRAGVDGFVHLVRDRDVDDDYLALVRLHPKVWSGPNIPVPTARPGYYIGSAVSVAWVPLPSVPRRALAHAAPMPV